MLSGIQPDDISLMARDSPSARLKLAGWSSRLTDMHRVAGVLASTLEDYVRSGQEHQHKTKALAEAFGTAGRIFSAGLLNSESADGGTETGPDGVGVRIPSPGAADALTVLSDTLHQIAEYQKMLVSQTEELTLAEVVRFRDKAAIVSTRRDRLNEISQVRSQAVAKLCQSSPQLVGNDGADGEYIKRASRAFTAKRAYTRATAEFATELGAFETDDKVLFLKRMTEQVFVHHGFFKQAAGVFDDASPLATSFFGVLNEGIAQAKPMNVEMLRLRDAAATLAHEEYSANVLALPRQRKVVVTSSAPAADKGGFSSTMKRLRQAAKEKMTEVSERKAGILDTAPPPSSTISPQEVTDRVLTNSKEGWVLRREKGTLLTSWKATYLRVLDDTLIEIDTDGGPDRPLCNLALLNVRRSEKAINDRLDCLDLVSPKFTMVLQAEGPRDCAEWQLVLSSGIVSAIHGSENSAGLSESDFEALLGIDGNDLCADCQGTRPMWCSINLGIMVCLRCSGGHRALGVRFSKVRSAKLDAWTTDAIHAMKATGNAISNAFYENRLSADEAESGVRPSEGCPQEETNSFIAAKYVERRWALPGGTPPGQPALVDGSVDDAAGGATVEGESEEGPQSPLFSKTSSSSSMASIDLATPAQATTSAPAVAMTPKLLTFSEEVEDDPSSSAGTAESPVVESYEVAGMETESP